MHEPCPACRSRLTRIHCGQVRCTWVVCQSCGLVWDVAARDPRAFVDPRKATAHWKPG